MRNHAITWARRALLLVGCGLLGYWAWATLDAGAFQAMLERRLDALSGGSRGGALLGRAAATRGEARTSGLVGRIEIPRVGVSALIVEGTTGRALRRGVGHVKRTAFPGERGNVALAGHRDTYFRGLRKVRRGDLIRIRTPDGTFAYEVDSILVVAPERGDLLRPTRRAALTLVTCYPFHWVGPAPERLVIRARPAERFARADAGEESPAVAAPRSAESRQARLAGPGNGAVRAW